MSFLNENQSYLYPFGLLKVNVVLTSIELGLDFCATFVRHSINFSSTKKPTLAPAPSTRFVELQRYRILKLESLWILFFILMSHVFYAI